ncbi:MAG TPA: hypothetical protein VME92_10495 [Acetobacteraceae bacterium]|nr:hypothetical protein [Acetobacteraceae bacterium]
MPVAIATGMGGAYNPGMFCCVPIMACFARGFRRGIVRLLGFALLLRLIRP